MRYDAQVTSRARTIFLACLLGCSGGAAASTAAPPSTAAQSGSAVERYFPLEEGKLYTYATRAGEETGTLSLTVRRPDPARGSLTVVGSSTVKRFAYTPDAVGYEGGAVLLRAPLEVGASWPGEHGGATRIDAIDADAVVPAGRYGGCVRTVEEGGRPPGSRYTTTYCPGIGMVLLEVKAPEGEVRAELTAYGAPVAMAPGTRVTIERSP